MVQGTAFALALGTVPRGAVAKAAVVARVVAAKPAMGLKTGSAAALATELTTTTALARGWVEVLVPTAAEELAFCAANRVWHKESKD